MPNKTHKKSLGLVLTDVNEVRRHIVYILEDIFAFLYQFLYIVLCLMLSFGPSLIINHLFQDEQIFMKCTRV